jgi:amidase
MFDEYVEYDALGLAALIAEGAVSQVEVLEAAIRRAEEANPDLNAIVTPLYDHARSRARESLSGSFAGVPFLLKDAHHALRGTPMSNGSRLHMGEISEFDAEIVRRFLDSGVVVFGKTNTPEYKLSIFTISEAWGATKNPWDHGRSAGGSSGGSAAAVAAGIAPMASATDEGGSIRMPASACGVFGLKPSRGRNPIGPDFGWEYEGQSTSHIVSRTVRDTAAMLDVTSGPEPGSPYVTPHEDGFLAALQLPVRQLRVGISTEALAFGVPMDPPCVSAVQETARILEGLGHIVEELPLPYDEWEVLRASITLAAAHSAALVRDLEGRYGPKKVRTSLEPVLRLLAAMGEALPAEAPAAARRTGLGLGLALSRFFGRFDLLVTPTLGRVPVPLREAEPSPGDQRLLELIVSRAGRRLLRSSRVRDAVMETQLDRLARQTLHRTMAANLSGVPAMSVPLHRTDDGLPVGVQFIGPFGDEVTLLQLAAQLEVAQPWAIIAGSD